MNAKPAAHQADAADAGRLIVVMGVAGSGKSTVGPLVAEMLDVPFMEGDQYHDARSVERMHRGMPLTDADRTPWLDRLHALLVEHRERGGVLACSALTREYRDRLRGELTNVIFVGLRVSPATSTARLEQRTGHFAGVELLASQLAVAELDDVVTVDGERSPRAVADAILTALRPTA